MNTKSRITDVNAKTEASYFLVLSHLGFFCFEWTAQTYFDIKFKTFSKALHGHHVIAMAGYLISAVNDNNHYYAISGFVLEMSTLFSCICYCLIKMNLSDTLFWKINQLILIHTFHLRSVLECILIYQFLKHYDEFQKLPIFFHITNAIGLTSLTFFLTPYWTYRKTEQLFKKSDWNSDSKSEKNGKEKDKKKH
jgi:ceroid-lipofuscinosis protein 8